MSFLPYERTANKELFLNFLKKTKKMKTSLRILPLMLGILFFFTQCEKDVIDLGSAINEEVITKDAAANCIVVQTLWAGAGQNNTLKGTNVGTVTATVDGNWLDVNYTVNAPYYLTEGHLWVGKNKLAIPRQAAPGLFPFKANLNFESEWNVKVNLSALGINPAVDVIYVSAHGVVNGINGLEGLEVLLPKENVEFKVFQPNGTLSYFKTEIRTEGFLEGYDYVGWCLDSKGYIDQWKWYTNATVYSSYGALPEGLKDILDYPENLPLLNWIINNIKVGEASPGGLGDYTRGDIQRAIWQLMEEYPTLNDLNEGPFSQARIDKIIEMAYASNGRNFKPVCGENVILIIWLPGIQTGIFEYPVPCGGESDTVWAYGEHTFVNLRIARKWGWIFEVNCPNP